MPTTPTLPAPLDEGLDPDQDRAVELRARDDDGSRTDAGTDAGTDARTGAHAGDRARWVFLSRSSLPVDPEARRLETRGRWWLALSYVLCPCHLPVTLSLLGLAFGGSALGATLAGNAVWVGAALTITYALVLWRGFSRLRRAKRLVGVGGSLDCTPSGCTVTPADGSPAAPLGPG